jgi:hypothetical protein
MGLLLAFAVSPALADAKSDCQRGIAMIKSEIAKKHPTEVRERLKKALSDAQNEEFENDWSECKDYIAEARKAVGK